MNILYFPKNQCLLFLIWIFSVSILFVKLLLFFIYYISLCKNHFFTLAFVDFIRIRRQSTFIFWSYIYILIFFALFWIKRKKSILLREFYSSGSKIILNKKNYWLKLRNFINFLWYKLKPKTIGWNLSFFKD